MNKKIISVLFLLVVLLCIAVTYNYFTQSTTDDQYNGSMETINDDDISNEIDDSFLEENEEIEIGEMI